MIPPPVDFGMEEEETSYHFIFECKAFARRRIAFFVVEPARTPQEHVVENLVTKGTGLFKVSAQIRGKQGNTIYSSGW